MLWWPKLASNLIVSMSKQLKRNSRIWVAGHNGLVGSALVGKLRSNGFNNLILRSRSELDLTNQQAVVRFFQDEHPEVVFLAAAKVGGIHANSHFPADFIHQNLTIETNVIHTAWQFGAEKLIFLGSSCIYPRNCPQPIKEDYLLSSPLESTNEAYAIAKIAGVKMCQAYRQQYGFDAIAAMPSNVYGPGDNFDSNNSHVLPALIRRFCEARSLTADKVEVWGDGSPKREFLHADDLASALIVLAQAYSDAAPVNIGSGHEIQISELAARLGGNQKLTFVRESRQPLVPT